MHDEPVRCSPHIEKRIAGDERKIASRSRHQRLHIPRIDHGSGTHQITQGAVFGLKDNLVVRFNKTQRAEELIAMGGDADIPLASGKRSPGDVSGSFIENPGVIALINRDLQFQSWNFDFPDSVAPLKRWNYRRYGEAASRWSGRRQSECL